jgi:hypothetical protein
MLWLVALRLSIPRTRDRRLSKSRRGFLYLRSQRPNACSEPFTLARRLVVALDGYGAVLLQFMTAFSMRNGTCGPRDETRQDLLLQGSVAGFPSGAQVKQCDGALVALVLSDSDLQEQFWVGHSRACFCVVLSWRSFGHRACCPLRSPGLVAVDGEHGLGLS